jgi:hypothetical protein
MIETEIVGKDRYPLRMKGLIMFVKPSEDMSPKTAPLLLTQPIETPAAQSVDAELTAGPAPERLTPEAVSKMFKEVTELVYGAGQKA